MIQNFLNLSDEKLKEIDYMIERLEKDHPLRFTRLEKDLCEAVMEVKPEMLNFYEMVYGGQTYNLMDVVAGVANICQRDEGAEGAPGCRTCQKEREDIFLYRCGCSGNRRKTGIERVVHLL